MTAIPQRCVDGAAALSPDSIRSMASELHADWVIDGTQSLERRLKVEDFQAALALVNAVAAVAEDENHHPDLCIKDNCFVTVRLATHDAGGLTANDFVMGLRFDGLAGR